jgi:hypothetical protein
MRQAAPLGPSKDRRLALLFLFGLVALWMIGNPLGGFGWRTFGFTVYNALPYPIVDLQVRPDGSVRVVHKTHELEGGDILWLLDSRPDMLIIATGWDGFVRIGKSVYAGHALPAPRILRTGEAVREFNRLRKSGVRVAMHLHSTC